jgi:uncharacterized protein
MNNSPSVKRVVGYPHPAIESCPRLRFHDVDDDWRVLLDADNVFWALNSRNASPQVLANHTLPTYREKQFELDPEMNQFRLKLDLSAVYINPTDRCHGSCPYCYIPAQVRHQGGDMPPAELDAVLKKIGGHHRANSGANGRKPVVVFHGSEPLLVKQGVFKAIEAYGKQMLFGIQTNATRLDEEDVAFLTGHRVSVGLSLDSVSPEGNRSTRIMPEAEDGYEAVMRALAWFDGYRGLSVITTITTENVTELPRMIKLLHANRVGTSLLNPVRCTAPGSESLRPDIPALIRYFKQAVDTALELTLTTGRKIVISNFANTVLAIIAPTARRLMCDITPCGAGRRFFAVMADGTAAPCGEFIGLTDFHGPNIVAGSIEEALASDPFKQVRLRVVEEIDECRQCLYRNICGAPCPAEVYALSGDLNRISPYCEFYKEMINYAFRLIAEGKAGYLLPDGISANMTRVYDGSH